MLSLATTDLRLRYRNSFLGFIWSFLEPLLMLGVLFYVFNNLFPSGIENFPIFLLLGLIMWYMYARATQSGLTSMISKGGMISKIYFPREVIPVASTITSFMMMGLEFAAFGFFAVIMNFVPPTTIVLLPLILLLQFILCLGTSLLLSILNVYFRDIQYIWAVILQAGFFITPIFYKLEQFPQNIRGILALNPMAGILETARDLTLYGTIPSMEELYYPLLTSLAILIVGYMVFKKLEPKAIELL